ncbi:hypothetical protein GCM10010441_49580 [Kitasatospora paracochleata]|uniref:Alkaline shock response membrane anchor protein AmaP n=1 Tax=Kitasatospora paracochleata TaxID=58354 RepID=A0ABT1ISU3_9ACTN|nr:hypothetical protein [Kitasatospora paracochleata]MCP2308149.1 hypothetical protein [Kitasatospora paracochleata]
MGRGAVNRTILAVVGVILLLTGLLALAGGLDLYGHLGLSMPSRWPWTSPDQPVLSAEARTRWSDRAWWWPVAIAVPSVVLAGGLWWLFGQVRGSGPAGIDLPSPAGPTGHFALHVRSRAVEEALETETIALPEVARITARVAGDPHHPHIRAALRMVSGGHTADLLRRYEAGPMAHARTTLGLADLRSELRIRVTGRRASATRGHHPRVH